MFCYSTGWIKIILLDQRQEVKTSNVRRGSRILVRGASGVLTPREALSPKFAKYRGFSLKIASKLHDLKQILGARGAAPWIRYWTSHNKSCAFFFLDRFVWLRELNTESEQRVAAFPPSNPPPRSKTKFKTISELHCFNQCSLSFSSQRHSKESTCCFCETQDWWVHLEISPSSLGQPTNLLAVQPKAQPAM